MDCSKRIFLEVCKQDILESLLIILQGTEEDYSRLLVEKRDKEIERLKLEKEKRDNEKKLKQMSQVQVIEVPDVKKGEEEEIKENSNGKLTIIRKTVQTELAFGNTKLTPNKGTPSKGISFFSLQNY